MNPEELKNRWRELGTPRPGDRPDPVIESDPVIDNVTSGKVSSARERLMRRYRMMFLAVAPAGILCTLMIHDLLPVWGMVVIMSFFAVAALMDYHLYRGIRSIDLSTEGVEEVARKARFYRRRHHIFQIILIPWAAVILGVYFSSFAQEEAMLWGMAAGGLVGLGAGLAMYFQMMRDYRSML